MTTLSYTVAMRVCILLVCLLTVCSSFGQPWQVSTGLFTVIVPQYAGAHHYRIAVYPNFSAKYKHRLFLNPYQGLGINLISNHQLTLGTSLSYNFAGSDQRSKPFNGLTDINDRWLAGGFVKYSHNLFTYSISRYYALGSLAGSGYLSPQLGVFLPLQKNLFINVSLNARYDDQRYMQGLYGVTTNEAKASGLAVYEVSSGWSDISASIMPLFKLTPQWAISVVMSIKRYVGQAEKSPIIHARTTYFGGLGISYRWQAANPIKLK